MSMGGVSFQIGNCPRCGQVSYPGQAIGHQCQPPDPRIMKELSEIKELLQKVCRIVETE